jgi:hypothetical protein
VYTTKFRGATCFQYLPSSKCVAMRSPRPVSPTHRMRLATVQRSNDMQRGLRRGKWVCPTLSTLHIEVVHTAILVQRKVWVFKQCFTQLYNTVSAFLWNTRRNPSETWRRSAVKHVFSETTESWTAPVHETSLTSVFYLQTKRDGDLNVHCPWGKQAGGFCDG